MSIVLESLLESLKDLAVSVQTEEVDDNIRATERELAELRDFLELIEAQPDGELDYHIKQWGFQAKKLESEAANLTETCMKKLEQMQRLSGLPFVKLVKLKRMGNELWKTRREISRFLKRGEKIGVNHKQKEADTWNLEDTTSKSSIYTYATSALRNLEAVLRSRLSLVPQELYKEVSRTRSQLLPVLEFLKLVNQSVDVLLDERQKVWIHMVEDNFKSINETSIAFRTSQLGAKGGNKQEIEFCEFVLQKKKEFFLLWSKWHIYGVGPFKGLYGSNIVVPHMEPATLSSTLFLPTEHKWKWKSERYKKVLDPIIEGFRIDLVFMGALWKDAKGMEEIDKREKIWLRNMKELHGNLGALVKKYDSSFFRPFNKLRFYSKLLQIAQLHEEVIYFLTMRKRYYGIDSFVQRDGSRSKHTQVDEAIPVPSDLFERDGDGFVLNDLMKALVQNVKGMIPSPPLPNVMSKRDKVGLVQIELQLMEALFEDVKTISQPDARLKVWLQEMHCVANHSKPIIQQILNGPFTSKVASTKIDWIVERIQKIYEWTLSYGIGSIRSGKGSSFLPQELEEVGPYPSDPVAEQVDLIRREARMMHALDMDMQNMQGTNSGTLEAWLQEMREVLGEAETLISSYSNDGGNIKTPREVLQSVELVKSKIQRLHQRRREYGIEHFDRKLSYTAEEFRARLLAEELEPFRIIPVIGAWDNDKAFIKKFIEEDDRIVYQFAWRIWLSAGEESEETILENIARVMNQKDLNDSLIVSQTAEILEDGVTQNRTLIVLDEIKSTFIFDSLRQLLRTSKGSRVVLITSQINVDLSYLNPSEMFSSITMRVLPV